MRYLLTVVVLGALAVPGWAQDPGDAPDHGVARISFIQGDVTVRRGDSGELVAAELNTPLVARDHVLTDEDSRAEIQLDWANFVRLASFSEVRMAQLADRDFLVQVAAGTVTVRVLRDSNSQVEISTPTVAIRPRLQGTYRVTVNDDNSTELTVRSGEVEIFAGQRIDYIHSGQSVTFRGDPNDPQRVYHSLSARDEWDKWNEARDRDLDRSDSYRYVSRDIYGAEDLYGYGQWVYDAPYGWVWVPRVDVGWAPYRIGRWSWVDYYGWTWVSADPWGWAPYHYGRWYHTPRYGWVWYPGEPRVRYYWRPALVAFFGWGGNVGWVSLAPREVYRPWYGPTHIVQNVTVVRNVNVLGTYQNAAFVSGRSGVTSVVVQSFGKSKINIHNFVAGSDRDFRRAEDGDRWLPHQATREDRQFSDRPVSPRETGRREPERKFVSTRPNYDDRNRSNEGRRADARPEAPRTGGPSENIRRVENSQPNETRPSPRNEPERSRQPEGDRGNGNRGNAQRPQPVPAQSVASGQSAPERGPQQQANRGRGEDRSVSAPAPVNSAPAPNPQRNASVVFPRNDGDRGRGQTKSSRAENPVRVTPSTPSEPVATPRSEPGRQRQQDNRGRSETPVAVAAPQPNTSVAFPRSDSGRGHQPENGNGRSEGFGRRSNDTPPQSSRPSETYRRAEPSGRLPTPDASPSRGAPVSGPRPEEVRRPQARESQPAPQAQSAPRHESRENPAPAQASSSSSNSSSDSHRGKSDEHNRGRDR